MSRCVDVRIALGVVSSVAELVAARLLQFLIPNTSLSSILGASKDMLFLVVDSATRFVGA